MTKPPTPAITAHMRRLQKLGVAARMARTTPEQRSEHARRMNAARWAKPTNEPKP